jgi:hypothetical protein
MQSFTENKFLFRSILGAHVVLYVALSEVFPPLNDLLELVSLPSELRTNVFALMVMYPTPLSSTIRIGSIT